MQSLNIVFTGKNQVEVREETLPELKPGDVLVKALKSLISTGTEGICYARLFAPGTSWDNWVQYPFGAGYSLVGEVQEVGSEVKTVKVGDRVALPVSHRQYAVAAEDSVITIPAGVSDQDAAWFHLGWITQIGVRRAAHELGDTVAVVGLGLLGQLVTQYARLSGAREVIAIDPAPQRITMALAHGATQGLALGVADAKEAISEMTHGRMADVVYDITGHPAVFAPALSLSRRFGTLLLLGDTGTPQEQRLTGDVINRGVKIVGAHDVYAPPTSNDYTFWTHHEMARLFLAYVERSDIRVSDMVTHHFAPLDAPKVYEQIMTERDSMMGVIFDWSEVR